SGPCGITAGPDGNLWFTESGFFGNRIGVINPLTHVVTEFSGLAPQSGPSEITAGPDGNLWFIEESGNRIGRVDAGTHAVSECPLTHERSPSGITAGPDGNLWFTESFGDAIGQVELIPPVTVAGVVVNDGSAQRSMVTSLTVTFSGIV